MSTPDRVREAYQEIKGVEVSLRPGPGQTADLGEASRRLHNALVDLRAEFSDLGPPGSNDVKRSGATKVG